LGRRKHRSERKRISTYLPLDTKNALDRMLWLLDMSEDEAMREALDAYLPSLHQRVQILMEARKLPSMI
jgi:dsDNA-binding SOS-regulon protein